MTQLAAERRAWRILMVSFGTFVLLCGALVYGIQWYVFQSMVELSVSVTAARGTVRVTLPDVQEPVAIADERTNLDSGSTIQTDATSQAVLNFTDAETGRPLAYLFVARDSNITLGQALAPRFALNSAPYIISASSSAGKSYVVIVADKARPLSFALTSSQGLVETSQPGQYAIEVTDNWTKVSVQNGAVVLASASNNSTLQLTSNQHGYLVEGQQDIQHPVVDKSLITNSQFTELYSAGWKAYSNGDPAGTVSNEIFQGRPVVTIDRGQARWPNLVLNHGETGLIQTVNADVGNFDTLELQASFYVAEQNLSTCGIAGSECPLMIRIVYTDPAGVERTFIHGYFAFFDPSAGYPLLCDTCRAEHERVRLQSWYTYSDNLFALLPPEQRPQFIKEISFYASGHAYVIHVSQMDLIGSKARQPDAAPK